MATARGAHAGMAAGSLPGSVGLDDPQPFQDHAHVHPSAAASRLRVRRRNHPGRVVSRSSPFRHAAGSRRWLYSVGCPRGRDAAGTAPIV